MTAGIYCACGTLEDREHMCGVTHAALKARVAYLEGAMRLIAEGTICPDLFPNDTDENVTAAKTAMTIALAALEHSESETSVQQEPSRGDPEDDKKGHP